MHAETERSSSAGAPALTFPLGGNLTSGPVKSISSFIFGEHLQHFHGIPRHEKVLKWQGNSATVPYAEEIKVPHTTSV